MIHPAIYEKSKLHGGKIFTYFEVPELREMAEAATVLHFRDSAWLDTGVDLLQKKVVVQEERPKRRKVESSCGSKYRTPGIIYT